MNEREKAQLISQLLIASLEGNLDELQTILTPHPELVSANNYHVLRNAVSHGYIEVLQYILTGKGFQEYFVPQLIDRTFYWSSQAGHFGVMKYLLTSPELQEAGHPIANIHTHTDCAVRYAAVADDVESVKYLLTSPELQEHANIYAHDCYAFTNDTFGVFTEVKKYLIFDYGIIQTPMIKKYIESGMAEHPANFTELHNAFEMRQLHTSLHRDLENGPLIKAQKI